jgi:hypothetical protein
MVCPALSARRLVSQAAFLLFRSHRINLQPFRPNRRLKEGPSAVTCVDRTSPDKSRRRWRSRYVTFGIHSKDKCPQGSARSRHLSKEFHAGIGRRLEKVAGINERRLDLCVRSGHGESDRLRLRTGTRRLQLDARAACSRADVPPEMYSGDFLK